ncbi:FAD-binding oxidoreductase [Cognatiyoonia sp.]|uniref:FAD-binding oxidoreductase n=1 Tax=Cognatiyoonia sp. TaxID=2211652 RepID=UPI003F6975F3
MDHITALQDIVGAKFTVTGSDADKWRQDWTGDYVVNPSVVVRPASTDEVAQVMRYAHAHDLPVVPVSGHTGLTGATANDGAVMLSVDRLNQIEQIDVEGRTVTVGSGVVLQSIHDAVEAHDLIFPLTFGARGAAMIGGALSTNAGGSNVVRYGNTRDLCLGIEVILADGRVMNLMSALHKDNSGYNLKHLVIGAEGTLGIITKAVLKLFTKPKAYATAMVATPSIADALTLLHRIQDETGGAVEAFELMTRSYIDLHLRQTPDGKEPFAEPFETNIMVEVGATSAEDAMVQESGQTRLSEKLEATLGTLLEEGAMLDAVVAQNESQRAEMWARREAAGHIGYLDGPRVDTDIAVPLDQVELVIAGIGEKIRKIDPGAWEVVVAHLGDGNIHHAIYPKDTGPEMFDSFVEAVEDTVQEVGGSFSAEHGVGLSKLKTMTRRKDPVALAAMQAVKKALDPKGILNPGKVIPPV